MLLMQLLFNFWEQVFCTSLWYKSPAPAAKASLSASVGTSSAQGSSSAPASVDQVVFPTTCGKAPHTPQWLKKCASKRLKNNRTKQVEYLFLYAAEKHCVKCMQWYVDKYNVDTRATSCKLNARGWAERSGGALPLTIDAFLQSLNLWVWMSECARSFWWYEKNEKRVCATLFTFLPDTARVDAACLCKSSLQLCPFAFAAVETAGVDGCGSHWFGVAPPVTDRCCMNASWIGALRTPDFY